MKFLILLAVIVGVVYSENCTSTDTTTCQHETCKVGFVPLCEQNICTCDAKVTAQCLQVSDCDKINYWNRHHCGHPHRECRNNDCYCTQHHG